MPETTPALNRTLSGLHLWGIAVGLVISGEYFGWSYGWAQAGTLGFLVTTVKIVVGSSSGWLHFLVWIGLLGLIASFHGIIIGYSRQIFALARAGLLPKVLATVHPRWRTPYWAILAGGVVGIAGQPLTASIVTMSVLGAIVMYIMSLLSLMRLRRREPHLERPFRAPLYPLFPLTALAIAAISLIAIVYYNVQVAALFAALGVVGGLVTRWRTRQGSASGAEPDALLHRPKAQT
jgi:ethanolamine permease